MGTRRMGAFFCSAFIGAGIQGFEEGPRDSLSWVFGTVHYANGARCYGCCQIVIETTAGFSTYGCTNSRGEFKIFLSSSRILAIYYRGAKAQHWGGRSVSAVGGLRVDLTVL